MEQEINCGTNNKTKGRFYMNEYFCLVSLDENQPVPIHYHADGNHPLNDIQRQKNLGWLIRWGDCGHQEIPLRKWGTGKSSKSPSNYNNVGS